MPSVATTPALTWLYKVSVIIQLATYARCPVEHENLWSRLYNLFTEVPEVPYGLKVLDKSGRSVQLSWAAPYDGNSPIKRYVIEYKISKGSWETDIDRVLVPGSQQNVAGVFNLRPATTYHLRIVAENEIGTSDPSDTVTIITAEEAPSGPPTSVRVDALDQHTLKVIRMIAL